VLVASSPYTGTVQENNYAYTANNIGTN